MDYVVSIRVDGDYFPSQASQLRRVLVGSCKWAVRRDSVKVGLREAMIEICVSQILYGLYTTETVCTWQRLLW